MPQQFAVEQINPLDLPSMPLGERNNFPSISCIYFVVDSESQVVYVGRTNNLKNRWIRHHRREDIKLIQNASVAWLEVTDIDSLAELEQSIIERLNPQLNGRTLEIAKRKSASFTDNSPSLDRTESHVDDIKELLKDILPWAKELQQKNTVLEEENRKLKDAIKKLTAIVNDLSE